jgi:hypothetical protein
MGSFDEMLDALAQAPVGSAVEVDLPRQTVLVVDGHGHPGSELFRQGVRDLWRAAYAVQKVVSRLGHESYAMPPTEVDFATSDRNGPWRMFFPQPDAVDADVLAAAYADLVATDKPVALSAHVAVREPERVVQTTHVGFPDSLPASVAVLDAYAADHGLVLGARQREVFVDDPIRVGFENARDLIRRTVLPG